MREILDRLVTSRFWTTFKKTYGYRIYYFTVKKPLKRIRDNSQRRKFKKHGYDVFYEVAGIARTTDMTIFCAYGTLLGIVREKKLIDHDYDLDYGILVNSQSDFLSLEKIMSERGFVKKREFRLNGEVKEQTYNKHGVDIDFFGFFNTSDANRITYVFFKEEGTEYPHNNYFSAFYSLYKDMEDGVDYETINGKSIPIPKNSIKIIEQIYGPNWRVPDKKFKHKLNKLEHQFGEYIQY